MIFCSLEMIIPSEASIGDVIFVPIVERMAAVAEM
jgi:hypothetical protein